MLICFWEFFPSNMPLLETTRLLIFENFPCQHVYSNHDFNIFTQKFVHSKSFFPHLQLLLEPIENISSKWLFHAYAHDFFSKIYKYCLLISPCMFIEIFNIFQPTCLFKPTCLLIFPKFSVQHVYSNYTFIRDSRVPF